MSPATDEENSNIMLLLDAAEELHKTASHDGPEPSTAATHGMLQPGCLDWSVNASDGCVMRGNAATHDVLSPGAVDSNVGDAYL